MERISVLSNMSSGSVGFFADFLGTNIFLKSGTGDAWKGVRFEGPSLDTVEAVVVWTVSDKQDLLAAFLR